MFRALVEIVYMFSSTNSLLFPIFTLCLVDYLHLFYNQQILFTTFNTLKSVTDSSDKKFARLSI